MDRLVIIDGHAIIHRAYHALPPLTTSNGVVVNAAYGFTSMLLRVIEELKPTHLVVVFDTPKPTFRNILSKEYQANRPKADDNLIPQFELVHKVVSEMGVAHFESDGFEADDVIGTIVNKICQDTKILGDKDIKENKQQSSSIPISQYPNIEVIIVTGDRDLMQLVNDNVKIYMPVKGLSQSKLYGIEEVEQRLGVKPGKVIDYKALIGDSSDNYCGVGGIGPKTAQKLLKTYGSFEEIYNNLDKMKSGSEKEKLIKGRESGELSKKLATIVKNAPIEFELEDCRLKSFDNANTKWLFEEMEFTSLIPRLESGIKNQELRIKNKKEMKTVDNIQQTSLF